MVLISAMMDFEKILRREERKKGSEEGRADGSDKENGCTGIVDGCGEGCNVGSDEGREKGLFFGTPLGVSKGLADDSPEGIQDRSLVIGKR